MKDYSDDIDILLEELKEIIHDEVALEIKRQTLQHWIESIYEDAYQEGLTEGLDRNLWN